MTNWKKRGKVPMLTVLALFIVALMFLAAWLGGEIRTLRKENTTLQSQKEAGAEVVIAYIKQTVELKRELTLAQKENMRLYEELADCKRQLSPTGGRTVLVWPKVEQSRAPKAIAPSINIATEGHVETWHTVEKGDWLSKLALKYHGDIDLWPLIWGLNRDIIDDPDLIYPGQILRVS